MQKFIKVALLMGLVLSRQSFAQTTLMDIQVQAQPEQNFGDAIGFESVPFADLPASSQSVSSKKMSENQILHLSEVTKIDASTTDSYNPTGYWDSVSVRGYNLDSRSNYLREGLSITAETFVPLDNKARVDILKGLSGIQAGASSPGGLVNYVVKRPTGEKIRHVLLNTTDSGNLLAAADVGGVSASNSNLGYRLNLAQEKLDPHLKNAEGDRSLVAFSGDWHVSQDSLLEAEIEWSRHSQPSQPGFSLLGNKLPNPVDPNINLNNQVWTQPVVFSGLTGTLRYTQTLAGSWSWSALGGLQSLNTDDRVAYPFGCTAEGNFDRYCSDGTFDMYDYRSDNESRESKALRLSLQGQLATGQVSHALTVGLMSSGIRERYQRQAFNFVGVGNVNGTATVPANPTQGDEATNRDSSNVQAFVSEAMSFGKWKTWLGLSMNYLERKSVRTDGSRETSYSQSFPIPWVALSYDFSGFMVYGSYGEGIESYVTPNKSGYNRAGEFLKDVRSRQYEVGVKGGKNLLWGVALFQIDRPVVTDAAPLFEIDGEDRHRGLELETQWDSGRWQLQVSAMILESSRQGGTLNLNLNDKSAVNVPNQALRLNANYQIVSVPGLSVNGRIVHEGERAVTADNSIMLSPWTRYDAGFSYARKWNDVPTTLQVYIDNLADSRYWRESPTQYGHIYLYPGESRTIGLTLQAQL